MSLSEKAVRHWFDLFRSNLPKDKTILEHIVQLDEAYFGRFSKLALLLGKQIGTRKLAYQILASGQQSLASIFSIVPLGLEQFRFTRNVGYIAPLFYPNR